jgi:hypothetical protein
MLLIKTSTLGSQELSALNAANELQQLVARMPVNVTVTMMMSAREARQQVAR